MQFRLRGRRKGGSLPVEHILGRRRKRTQKTSSPGKTHGKVHGEEVQRKTMNNIIQAKNHNSKASNQMCGQGCRYGYIYIYIYICKGSCSPQKGIPKRRYSPNRGSYSPIWGSPGEILSPRGSPRGSPREATLPYGDPQWRYSPLGDPLGELLSHMGIP